MASANFYLEDKFIGSTKTFGTPEDILGDPVIREALTEEFKKSEPDVRRALEKGEVLNGSREELTTPHFVYVFQVPEQGARVKVLFYDVDNE